MSGLNDRGVSNTLQNLEVHQSWASAYRTPENEPFYQAAFDYVQSVFGDPQDGPVLDAGCGSSTKSIHLAKRGYEVVAIDFSERILEMARAEVAKAQLGYLVSHQQANLTALPFADRTFKRVLCWGVLMHVPQIEQAVSELARVTAPGGLIVISENNVHSIHATALRGARRLLGRNRAEVRATPAGIERWEGSSNGLVVTRTTRISWLVDSFERGGARLVARRAGEFTQVFAMVQSRPVPSLAHVFNRFWFHSIRAAGPALGNLLVFRKDQ